MLITHRPHAVIFDMDGLIFDTEVLYHRALLQLASELGLTAIDESVVLATIGLSWDATRDHLALLVGDVIDPDELTGHWKARFSAMAEQQVDLKPGVIELLDILEGLAIPRAIATGSYRAVADHHLKTHHLGGYFDAVVTKEDCESGKPAPDPFVTAAKRLGVSPKDCWALEDSPNGIISAHAAGMTPIMVPDLIEPNDDIAQKCHLVVRSLLDVRDLLIA